MHFEVGFFDDLVTAANYASSDQRRKTITDFSLYFPLFFNDTATTEIYTLSLHDALPIWIHYDFAKAAELLGGAGQEVLAERSEEHTSELQSPCNLVCRLLLEKQEHNRDTERTPEGGKSECGVRGGKVGW